MKSFFLMTMLLIAAVALIACGGEKAEDQELHAEHAEHADHADHADHHHAHAESKLTLNDGKKWPMDDHTRKVFAKMATSFLAINPATMGPEDGKKAGLALQEDINALIKGCTMTGPAHDQLHLFLSEYIPAVGTLAESGTTGDAMKVRGYLETYGTYFE